ncbi:MAG: DUF6090 family protein [Cyclobacteriaceae bacterium]
MKRLLTTLKEKWPEYLLEIIVLVVGIYGAFALDSWNEHRKNASEEQQMLRLLYDDFQNSKIQSERLIDRESEEIQTLVAALGTKAQVDSLFNATDDHHTARTIFWAYRAGVPVFSSFEDFKSSGKIGIIQSPEIRFELTKLEQKIHALIGGTNSRTDTHRLLIDAGVVEDLNYLPLIIDERINLAEGQSTDYRGLLTRQKIRNLIGIKLQMAINILQSRKELNDQIIEVLAAIEKEIE